MHPFAILLVGMATILGAIIWLRVNAFLALIVAAFVVSLLSPGDPAAKVGRVAEGFGRTAASVGVIIALAAIIGNAMSASGASDRIVKGFVDWLGEKRDATALGATAFVLSLPVFFDTIFFLLAPLARSMYARTNRSYMRYLLAMSASGVATHTLVPPHPGPLAVADALGIDLGLMVLVGIAVAIPAALVGNYFAKWSDARAPIPMRVSSVAPEAVRRLSLPPLALSLVPVLLPVVLISSNTIFSSLRTAVPSNGATWSSLAPYVATLGNANLALLLSAGIALLIYARQRQPGDAEVATVVESSLMGAGVIILIVAAGGAFGATLQAAQIGPAVQHAFGDGSRGSGFALLFVAFGVVIVMKIAQGSSTVAMITTAGMLGAMIKGVPLSFNKVYLATAIASGSLIGSWMNDAGFWVFSRVGGVTEIETLRSWTPLCAIVGATAMLTTIALVLLLPMR
jgi:GntP family gluconate:H+ symporter